MSAYRAVLLALFVVGGATVAAVPASGTTLHGDDGDAAGATGDFSAPGVTDERVGVTETGATAVRNETRNNSSLGADISSFMQSSAAEVGGAVEVGMWTAAYNGTENRTVRAQLVERQTADLRDELADLRERKAELVAERNATNVSDAAYKAKIGQLIGRIDALKAAIDATAVRAKEVDANASAVATLQTEAENLTGPEIASVAKNVTGVSADVAVGNGERGSPTGLGNGTTTGNGKNVGVADAGNRTIGPSNGVANGTPDGVGNGTTTRVANGTTNGVGNGTTTQVANGTTNGVGNGTTTQVANRTTTRAANGTANESQRDPPSHANASTVDDKFGRETANAPNGGTSATGDNATASLTDDVATAVSSDGTPTDDATLVLGPVGTATSDPLGPVSGAFAASSNALSFALALA